MSAKIDISPEQLAIVQGILKDHLPKGTLAWAFGSRVTWTAKPFSDLDIALEGLTPLSSDVLIDLEEAFEASDLPWKVDVIDLNTASPEFRAIVERQRVPADWEEHVFEDCLDRLIDYRGKSPQKSDFGIPVLSAKVVKTEGLVRPIEQKIALDYYPKWMTRGIPTVGDVIFTTEGPLGEVIQLDEETSRYALGQRIVCLRGKKGKLDNTFLRYLLTSPQQRAVIEGRATGTTVLGISQKALRQMPVILPSISEQEEIGSTLSAIDDKIELNRRMNETLEAMARAVFRDWFVDFGPTRRKAAGETDPTAILGGLIPDLEKTAPLAALFPDSLGAQGQPVGWKSSTLLEIAELNPESWSAKKHPQEVEYVDLAITKWGVIESTAHYPWSDAPSRARRIARTGDTIVGTVRPGNGSFSFVGRDGLTVSTGFAVLRPRQEDWQSLVYCAATDRNNVERLAYLADGGAYPAIRPDVVLDTPLPEVNAVLYSEFGKVTNALFELIESYKRENQTLAATRDLLLPKLMSGELRLTSAEGTV